MMPPLSAWCLKLGGRLQATPNMTCLIVNHENTTWNYYTGRDRSYLLPAAIFRMGGAAVLMSNRCRSENWEQAI